MWFKNCAWLFFYLILAIYMLVPNTEVEFRPAAIGALMTVILSLVTSNLHLPKRNRHWVHL